jgi:endoglucanase
MAGDWTGDGIDTVGVFRSGNQRVYLRFSNAAGVADVEFLWGEPSFLPVAGHFRL